MFLRIIIITTIILIGIAFLAPSNPYTNKVTEPMSESFKKIYSFVDDEVVDLPVVVLPSDTTTIHKWQDKDGKWHFSNTEPPKDTDSKTNVYKNDDNIMPATKTKTKD